MEEKPSLLAVALTGGTRDWHIAHEILVYRDEVTGSEIEALNKYVADRTRKSEMPAGGGKTAPRLSWRDEPGVRVSLIPLAEFQKVFIYHAHKHRNLVVSYESPRALAHIATAWDEVERGERFVKGWALEILAPRKHDPESNFQRKRRRRPSVFVKRMSGGALRMELNSCGRSADPEEEQPAEGASWHRGQLLDLSRLAYGLSAEERSLEDAFAAFTGESFDPGTEPVDRHRRRARASLALAETLVGHFDRLPVSRAGYGGRLSETTVQSPAGLTRAFASAIGFAAPAVPQRDRLAASAAAFYGGRIEAAWHGFAPVVSMDFSKTYAMIAALLRIQDYLAAEEIRFEDATEDARELAILGRAELLRCTTWPKLAILCWVRLRGEIVPTKALFDGRQFAMGMPKRWSDGLVPLFLPDVIAAKRCCGRAPEIVRAERMVPVGRRVLRSVHLPSGVSFDPKKDDIFRALVEEGERLRRGDGHWKKVPAPVRDVLYPGWKAGNNGLAFGLLAQTNIVEKAGEAREEVTLVFDEGELRVRTSRPEEPGSFFCLPLAALVTACGRLLLAMIDELVAEKGGTVAMGHTDSAHIIATETGGPVTCEIVDTDPKAGGGARRYRRAVHALSWCEVDEIAAAFASLNPFDPDLMPGSPLKVKTVSEKGRRIETRSLVITPMHYCLIGPDGEIIDGTGSLLGMYLPPVGDAAKWRIEAWRHIVDLWQEKRIDRTAVPWLGYPAVSMLDLSRPEFAVKVERVAQRPFDRFLVSRLIGRKAGEKSKTGIAIAPCESAPERWAGLPWRFYETGELINFGRPDSEGWGWHLGTVEEMLRAFTRIHPHGTLDAAGMPCRDYTRGPLQRMAIRDGAKFVTTKESLTWSDDPAFAFTTPAPEAHLARGTATPEDSCDWNVVHAALRIVGPTAVARRLQLDPRSARHWLAGRGLPESPKRVAEAVAVCGDEAGLILPSERALSAEAICGRLPERAAIVQLFVAGAVDTFSRVFHGMRELSRTAGISETNLRNWRALAADGGPRPIGDTNAIAAKLAKVARAKLRETQRRFALADGPRGDWEAIYAWLLLAGRERPPVPEPADLFAYMAGVAAGAFSIWPFPATETAGQLHALAPPPDMPSKVVDQDPRRGVLRNMSRRQRA